MLKIVFIGAGNVATHLSIGLQSVSYEIVQIYSRTLNSAQSLAERLQTSYTIDIAALNPNADLYIFAVSDNVVPQILKQITDSQIFTAQKPFFVHTTGSVNMNVFEGITENYGVFYPLQTFSKVRIMNLKETPFCIEANTDSNAKFLFEIAQKISDKVFYINSLQRLYFHLAAVFACNFSNYFYSLADEFLTQKELSFDLLKPLILETTQKIISHRPAEVQTGPAIRNDTTTINIHLDLLAEMPDLQKIYSFVSEQIKSTRK